jgi:hypothetical protein
MHDVPADATLVGGPAFGDEVAVACRDPYGCWGWLLPRRESSDPFFSADDVDLLAAVSLDLAAITRRIWSFQTPTASLPQAGVVILDDHLRFTSLTVIARMARAAHRPRARFGRTHYPVRRRISAQRVALVRRSVCQHSPADRGRRVGGP